LLKILREAFKDEQPLTSFSGLDLPNFTPIKRLRRLAFEVGLDSVQIVVGSLAEQRSYTQYITKSQAAEAVSSVDICDPHSPTHSILGVLQLFPNLSTLCTYADAGSVLPPILACYPRLLHLSLFGYLDVGMGRLAAAFPSLESLESSSDSNLHEVAFPLDLQRLFVRFRMVTSAEPSMIFDKLSALRKLKVLTICGRLDDNEIGLDIWVAALAMLPGSVRHLALDGPDFCVYAPLPAALAQLAARPNWLPNLQSLSVGVVPWVDQESQDALKETCAVHRPHVRLSSDPFFH
jgi:hypothetical protein